MALRDNDAVAIVGEPTAGMLFGRDLEPLEDGLALMIRIAPRILSPIGKDYTAGGVTPDMTGCGRRRQNENARGGGMTIANPETNRLSGHSECRSCLCSPSVAVRGSSLRLNSRWDGGIFVH